MQESTQNSAVVANEIEGALQDAAIEQPEKTKRKSPTREEVRLSEKPSTLLSKEGFAMYIGKTVSAVASMAKAGKLPAVYMADPLNPSGHSELYINKDEWDEACKQLTESAPPEWHDWKNRLFLFKPTGGKQPSQEHKKKNTAMLGYDS